MQNTTAAPHIIELLREQGWATSDEMFAPSFWAAFSECIKHAQLLPAGTGRGQDFRAHSVRGDHIQWLAPSSAHEVILLEALDQWRSALGRALMTPLDEVEAHVACYGPGKGYARHLDSLKTSNTRRVSLVCYANANWALEDGGALRIHLPTGPLDVLPILGRSVVFMSDEIEHEVMAATKDRWSLAGWFKTRPKT